MRTMYSVAVLVGGCLIAGCGGSDAPSLAEAPLFDYGIQMEEKYEWTGSDWGTPVERETYTYDESKRTVSWLEDKLVSGNDARTTYTYTSTGRIATALYEQYITGVWLPLFRYTYSYDGSDRLTQIVIATYSGGVWTDAMRYVYTYDGGGRVITKQVDMNSAGWVPSRKYEYTYNAQNRLLEEVYYDTWTGSAWGDPREKDVHLYYASGRLQTRKTYAYVGPGYSATAYYSTSFTYDGSARVTREENGTGDFGNPGYTMTYYFNYTYGGDGRLAEKIWGGPLGDHTRYVFTFTDSGSSYTKQILDAVPLADFEVYGIGRLNRYE